MQLYLQRIQGMATHPIQTMALGASGDVTMVISVMGGLKLAKGKPGKQPIYFTSIYLIIKLVKQHDGLFSRCLPLVGHPTTRWQTRSQKLYAIYYAASFVYLFMANGQ